MAWTDTTFLRSPNLNIPELLVSAGLFRIHIQIWIRNQSLNLRSEKPWTLGCLKPRSEFCSKGASLRFTLWERQFQFLCTMSLFVLENKHSVQI